MLCDFQPLIVSAWPSTRVRARPKAPPVPVRLKGAAAIVLSWAIRWTRTLLLSCRDPTTLAIKNCPATSINLSPHKVVNGWSMGRIGQHGSVCVCVCVIDSALKVYHLSYFDEMWISKAELITPARQRLFFSFFSILFCWNKCQHI